MHHTIQRHLAALLAALALLVIATAAPAQGLRPSGGRAPAFSVPALPEPAGSLGRAAARQQPADYIVAVVNSEPITNNELRERAERIAQQLAQQGAPVPPRDELLRQVLERMISDRAQLQLARETGIKIDDGAVDLAEQNVARQNKLTVAQLRQRVAADGLPQNELRDELRRQLTLQRLRDRELEPKVKITELDIDQFLQQQQQQQQPQQPSQPGTGAATQLDLAQVLVAVPEGTPAAEVARLQQRAAEVAQRARAGDDFAQLAREFSDAPERATGGRMGLRSADRYPPLFVEATQAVAVGGIAGPVRSGAGFHVLKVLEKGSLGSSAGMTVQQNHARHILLRPNAQLSEADARARLADFKRRVESGSADFAALAREYSQDTSAKDGGDLGWSSPGQYVPEFEQVLSGLAPGQIGAPFTSRFGVHLVQLLEQREATLNPRQQRDLARSLLREKKLDEAYGPWAQEVRNRAYVDLREPPQ